MQGDAGSEDRLGSPHSSLTLGGYYRGLGYIFKELKELWLNSKMDP